MRTLLSIEQDLCKARSVWILTAESVHPNGNFGREVDGGEDGIGIETRQGNGVRFCDLCKFRTAQEGQGELSDCYMEQCNNYRKQTPSPCLVPDPIRHKLLSSSLSIDIFKQERQAEQTSVPGRRTASIPGICSVEISSTLSPLGDRGSGGRFLTGVGIWCCVHFLEVDGGSGVCVCVWLDADGCKDGVCGDRDW